MIEKIRRDLRDVSSREKALVLQRFFKTGKGEYGEGDLFLGVVVPDIRRLVRVYWKEVGWKEIGELVKSGFHEERLLGLLILVCWYEKNEGVRREVFEYYLRMTGKINNWDLVDLTASKIVGNYCRTKLGSIEILKKLARSKSLWERRVAVIACFDYIYAGSDKEIYEVADLVIDNSEDLMHKALGWMLREAGKRVSLENEEKYILKNYDKMARTALRYAIERFDEEKRKKYLERNVPVAQLD